MIYFIGAGPGDPELITVKGAKLLQDADLIIYAGSLVNREVLRDTKADCQIFDSSGMTLAEVVALLEKGHNQQKTIIRLHTGDPCLYGAIQEQMAALEARRIAYEVVPGVSSFCAAAAALKREYTLPGVSQTVILTRMAGRTAVPSEESIAALARHQATMVIFLSVGMIEALVAQLRTSYPPETPVAVVYKASWPQQRILRGELREINVLVQQAGLQKTALVLVGNFLGDDYQLSRLYASEFSHGFRVATVKEE